VIFLLKPFELVNTFNLPQTDCTPALHHKIEIIIPFGVKRSRIVSSRHPGDKVNLIFGKAHKVRRTVDVNAGIRHAVDWIDAGGVHSVPTINQRERQHVKRGVSTFRDVELNDSVARS